MGKSPYHRDYSYSALTKPPCSATWESVNELIFPPCNVDHDGTNGDTVKCTIKSFIFTPQTIGKLEDDMKAVKDSEPVAKPSACKNPPKCDA